jgi:putative ABC transport system substrate-binding protein
MNVPPEKYLDLLAQVIPSPKKIGIIYDPAKTGDLIRRAKQAAAARDLEISALAVTRANDVPQALDSLKGRADALLILPDTTVVTPETVESFLIFSQNNNVPVIAFAAKYVEMGALLSLDIDSADQGRQAGELARRILNGTPVSALPPTEARSTHLKVNRNVANKLGISLLAGATKEY